MYVAEIWRYPVKSMAGEQLESAHLTPSGIDGDRVVQVRTARGARSRRGPTRAFSRTGPRWMNMESR
jgi:uncharacterized protein